jgi:diguanylate cyclase (GGDEF)-like protein
VTALPVLLPTMTFDEAARLVLGYLRTNVPLAFWSVTRVENGRQTYLYLDEENGYGLPTGGSHPWEDSFCIHMAAGTAPAVAPDAQQVPLYAAAGVNAAVTIGSYAGASVAEPDGTLFGAICGIDPKVRTDDPALLAAGPILSLFGQLLTMVLAANRARDAAARDLALARTDAETDTLTGLLNRRGWERAVSEESARFQRFGDPTVVAMIDLDRLKVINDEQGHDAGDAYIREAGTALSRAVRGGDVVARLGGDEFGVLMTGCTEELAAERIARLYARLEEHGVAGSVGWAPISVLRGFPAALAEADEAMYAAKRARRSRRGPMPQPREAQPDRVLLR